MYRKVYAIRGRSAAIITIPVGRSGLRVEFEKGCLDRKNYRPATYSTTDPTIQQMIEDSTLFKGGSIVLHKIYNLGGDDTAAVAAKSTEETVEEVVEETAEETAGTGLTEHPEITTLKDAAALLKSLGAPASKIKSTEMVKACAADYGVSFPNL